jgi:LPS-assembly lipoprotein
MTRAPRRVVLLAGLGGLLTGCGFRPVYAPTAQGGASPALAAIEVAPLYDRPGQILREALKARLASDTGVPHRFGLAVNFSISGEGLGVLPTTEVTRVRLTANAAWVLTKTDTKQTQLATGNEKAIDGFDTFDTQYFATDLRNERVQRRLAERIADQIGLRLAIWFNQHPAEAA